jgi:hypothetical protein
MVAKMKNKVTVNIRIPDYSEPPNTGPSGIQMVIFWTLFESGFQMVKGSHFAKTIRKPNEKSGFRMVGHLFTI